MASKPKPVFGMNRGTVGFMMNDFDEAGLMERVLAARTFDLHPLLMTAETVNGETIMSPAINEVSLLRETRQAAKIEIAIDGKVRMEELICDGVLVATPAGSTAVSCKRVSSWKKTPKVSSRSTSKPATIFVTGT